MGSIFSHDSLFLLFLPVGLGFISFRPLTEKK
jgi:hypothetical protein